MRLGPRIPAPAGLAEWTLIIILLLLLAAVSEGAAATAVAMTASSPRSVGNILLSRSSRAFSAWRLPPIISVAAAMALRTRCSCASSRSLLASCMAR